MQKIRWNKDELALLHKTMVDIFLVRASTTDEAALRGAQQVLPADRRGKITYARVYNHKERIAAAKAEADGLRKVRAEPASTPKPEPAPAPEPVAHPVSLGNAFETLVEMLVERVTSRVLQAIVEKREGSRPSSFARRSVSSC